MKRSFISERNASITIPVDRVVVWPLGGIREGIACPFAQAGAEVWIVGRNEAQGNLAGEQARCFPENHFIKADLSLFAEAKRVPHDIRTRAGPGDRPPHVSRSWMLDVTSCLGAPPNGTYIRSSEGIEQHVAAQVLSRFMLGYALTVDAYCVVKKGLMTVMKPGFRWSALDLDDIDMPWHASMLLVRLYRYGHVYRWLAVMGQTPASYPEVPFYLLVNPVRSTATSSVLLWDENADEMAGNPAFPDEGSRAAHLGLFDGKDECRVVTKYLKCPAYYYLFFQKLPDHFVCHGLAASQM
ncbi:hypothetical protein JB92DRAFT_2839313 [Gautieria morchelliformis]|nr:hypothetical protein JB92DRAFT_2839313 [Gautieria morchelliformis]